MSKIISVNAGSSSLKFQLFEMDDENNLFITKNTTNPAVYPCLVAHMDR